MSSRWWSVGVLTAALVVGSCGGPDLPEDPAVRARLGETQRVADIVSQAIGYPRQDSAAGFARAANATTAAQDGRLTVVGMRELEAEANEDALAQLTFRIHLDGFNAGLSTTPAITACYDVDFNRYGVIGSPKRINCPANATAVSVPPAPAEPDVPNGSDKVVRAALRHAAVLPVADDVRAEIVRGVSRLITDPAKTLPPEVSVTVDGSDVALALTGEGDCVLARRISGAIEIWHPPSITVQPGELSCSPETALAGLAMNAPH